MPAVLWYLNTTASVTNVQFNISLQEQLPSLVILRHKYICSGYVCIWPSFSELRALYEILLDYLKGQY